MSALADAASTADKPVHGKPCSVGEARASMDKASAKDFDAWLRGEGLRLDDTQMWKALQAMGHRVAKQTVGRHRRGDCRCSQ